jgi:hypothetical protein
MIEIKKQFWADTLIALIDRIRKRTKNHKNMDGEAFEDYSSGYEELKTSNKVNRGVSQKSTSGNPDMTLTGAMLYSDFNLLNASDKGGEFGWLTRGNVVKKLAKFKNYKIVDPSKSNCLGEHDTKFVQDEFNKMMGKELGRNSFNKVIKIKI